MRRLWQLSIYAVLASDIAAAQGVMKVAWPIDSGSKVRVLSAALGPEFRDGTLVFASNDSLVIAPRKSPAFSVTTEQIGALQMARGSHTSKAKYALVGFLIGAASGAALGAASYKPTKCPPYNICLLMPDSRGFDATLGGVLGGGLGAIIGVLAGASPKDTWVPIALPSR